VVDGGRTERRAKAGRTQADAFAWLPRRRTRRKTPMSAASSCSRPHAYVPPVSPFFLCITFELFIGEPYHRWLPVLFLLLGDGINRRLYARRTLSFRRDIAAAACHYGRPMPCHLHPCLAATCRDSGERGRIIDTGAPCWLKRCRVEWAGGIRLFIGRTVTWATFSTLLSRRRKRPAACWRRFACRRSQRACSGRTEGVLRTRRRKDAGGGSYIVCCG